MGSVTRFRTFHNDIVVSEDGVWHAPQNALFGNPHEKTFFVPNVCWDLTVSPGRGAQPWPGMATRELTRYPVARLRMINTSLQFHGAQREPGTSRPVVFYFGALPKMMRTRRLQTWAATVLFDGCCKCCSRNPPHGGIFVELSAWPSFDEAGELRQLLVA